MAAKHWPLPSCFNPYARACFIAPVAVDEFDGYVMWRRRGIHLFVKAVTHELNCSQCLRHFTKYSTLPALFFCLVFTNLCARCCEVRRPVWRRSEARHSQTFLLQRHRLHLSTCMSPMPLAFEWQRRQD